MSLFSKIAGTTGTFYQIGGPAGPGINDNSGVLEGRNATNSSYIVIRGNTPILSNDLTTKAYVDGYTFVAGGDLTGTRTCQQVISITEPTIASKLPISFGGSKLAQIGSYN